MIKCLYKYHGMFWCSFNMAYLLVWWDGSVVMFLTSLASYMVYNCLFGQLYEDVKVSSVVVVFML